MKKCYICNKECINYSSLSQHVKKYHKIEIKYYYDNFLKKSNNDGECAVCNSSTKFKNINLGYLQYCSGKCQSRGVANREDVKIKRISTCTTRYGGNSPASSKDVLNKMKTTLLKRYGVDSIFKLQDCKKNRRLVDNTQVQNNRRLTCLAKYGVDHIMKVQEFKDKCLESFKHSNLPNYPSQNQLSKESFEILNDKYKLESLFLKNNQIRHKTCEQLNIAFSTLTSYFKIHNLFDKYISAFKSDYEKQIYEFLISFLEEKDIKTNVRGVIHRGELDFLIEKYNFAIEFNGSYFHSENIKGKDYHLNKSNLCSNKSIFLYHIFEKDWYYENKRNIIKSRIKSLLGVIDNKIFARKCTITKLNNLECRDFLDKNHLQGSISSKVNIALKYNEEIVSVMTFGKPRFNNNYKFELLRFCSKLDTTVVGGASKLLKYFIRTFNPDSIISYCNVHNSKGEIYANLGFNLKEKSPPSYFYWLGVDYLSRYQCQKHKLIEKYKDKIQDIESKTENEIMKLLGYRKVYDCGNFIFTWETKNFNN